MGGGIVKRDEIPDSLKSVTEPGALSGEILIRQASLDDIRLIQDMARIIWADTYAGYISEEDQSRVLEHSYSQASLKKSIEDDIFLLAEISGEAAGYIDMGRQDEVLHLHRLYVMSKFQRLGTGRRLLDVAVAVGKGCSGDGFPSPAEKGSIPKVVVATVEEGNQKARRFYRKMGFAEEGSTTMTIQGVKMPLIYIVMRLS